MDKKIIKAEVLWTYKCFRNCLGCGMKTGIANSRSLIDWKQGMLNVQKLGAEFAAFYGAEPLCDFTNLPEIVSYCESIGINTTVITSASFNSKTKEKLRTLYKNGLRSLTTSFDIEAYDSSSEEKTNQAIEMLEYFRMFGPIRDVAAVVTVNRNNVELLPYAVELLSRRNIWTFFDLMHYDKGNPGTKCKGSKTELHLDHTDTLSLARIFSELKLMQTKGFLIHMDELTMEMILKDNLQFNWNCAQYDQFPSWITIAPDGEVFPCDDFKPSDLTTRFDMTEIYRKWNRFSSYYRKKVKIRCKGCLWCTHIQAHSIKGNILPIESYIHKTG